MGTDLPIYLLKEIIAKYNSQNGSIFMCFLDASKAFDRVNHSLLFHKLLKQGIPVYIVRLLCFWYSHQTLCVRWAGLTSSVFTVGNGVRQGGVLSPYLFNFYVNDLSVQLNTCHTGCAIGGKLVNHIMCTDDLVIFSPSDTGLAELLQVCESFADDHDMLFNSSKSAIMIIRNRTMKTMNARLLEFRLCNDVIPTVDKYKYLGHILCDNFRDDDDMLRQCRHLYAQGNVLKHRFHMCSVAVKLKLFRTFCYSLYTAHLWWNYAVCSFKKVNVAYNNAFRLLMLLPRHCSASGMFVQNNVYTFKALLRKYTYKFIRRLELCSNSLIVCLLASDLRLTSQIRLFWHECLVII